MIYFDNCATTKPSAESIGAMEKCINEDWGNPSSMHKMGLESHHRLETARTQLKESVGIRRPSDGGVIFTSGGSESNSLAIIGSFLAKKRGNNCKVIISAGEHSSVHQCADKLREFGCSIIEVPTVGGELDLNYLENTADASVILMAIMLVNNETGAVYNFKTAADIVRRKSPSAFIHCDAIQGYMKIPFTLKSLGADTVAVSSHKIFSLKGSGALFYTPEVIKGRKLTAIIPGGGQENNLRSGTENVPGICAFGAAAEMMYKSFAQRDKIVREVRDTILANLPEEVKVNIPINYVPHIISLTLPRIKSETMLNFLSSKGICVSSGSACSSHSKKISGALVSFGLEEIEADCTIRISLSHENTVDEAEEFISVLSEGVKTLQRIK